MNKPILLLHKTVRSYFLMVIVAVISTWFSTNIYSQQNSSESPFISESTLKVAPVKLDGRILFNVRGISSFPAQERAAKIGERIKNIAETDSILVTKLKLVHGKDYSTISIGDKDIVSIFDADAEIEGIERNLAALVIGKKIGSAINKYRYDRSKPVILKNITQAVISSFVLIIILFIVIRLSKRINNALQNRIRTFWAAPTALQTGTG